MRSAERRQGDEGLLAVHQAGDRVDPCHLQRGVGVERGQDPREPAREHRLPRPRRPAEEAVVPARGSQLERAASTFLAADVGEVGRRHSTVRVGRQRPLGIQLELAAQVRDGLGEVANRHGGDAGERSLPSGVGRTEETLDAEPPGALRNGENAAHAPEAAVESELSDGGRALERAPRQLLRGGEHGQRDRQVEAGAFLAQLGGREVDGDAPVREAQLCGRDPAADALPGLLAGPVGEADDREAGKAVANVGFDVDVDAPRLEADERVRDRACEHASRLRAEC